MAGAFLPCIWRAGDRRPAKGEEMMEVQGQDSAVEQAPEHDFGAPCSSAPCRSGFTARCARSAKPSISCFKTMTITAPCAARPESIPRISEIAWKKCAREQILKPSRWHREIDYPAQAIRRDHKARRAWNSSKVFNLMTRRLKIPDAAFSAARHFRSAQFDEPPTHPLSCNRGVEQPGSSSGS